MPLLVYKPKRFSADSERTIGIANGILDEYESQGFDLTLRQLYYQFVARGLISNSDREYKRLGSIVNDARLAGRIDWHHITDRTRNLRAGAHWTSPSEIISGAAGGYRIDKWETQATRVEVWIEKDALVGVIGGVCSRLDVPYFSCRGYTSQSEMWSASQRLGRWLRAGYDVRVLHLGDHDPSGIDMSRDIEERLFHFIAVDHHRDKGEGSSLDGQGSVDYVGDHFRLDRLALNWDQVQQYNPPPNPAKLTDSRGAGYVEEYGDESWELDALEPNVIVDLVEEAVLDLRDPDLWDDAVKDEDEQRAGLKLAARNWPAVVEFLNTKNDENGGT